MVWFRKRANKQVNISDGVPSFSSLFGTQQPISEGFAMQVEDIFSIRGRGSVVTGKVANGKVTVGDTVRIGGNGYETECRVEGIEVFHATLTSAEVGMNVGILFRSLDRKSVERGMWVRSACCPALVREDTVSSKVGRTTQFDSDERREYSL